jgi:3-phosphoshikimate 1-carboxyvinyltransferase
VDARGDHRIAMLGAVAGLASREGVELREPEAVAVSFPGFFELLAQVAQRGPGPATGNLR